MFEWSFIPMRDGDMNVDPIQGEFFADQDISGRLVRETLQNSLDARDRTPGTNRVRVRFTLSSGDSIPKARAEGYFQGLERHIRACGDDADSVAEMGDLLDGPIPTPCPRFLPQRRTNRRLC